MILNLPHCKRRTFKKHFLIGVYCEVEYQAMANTIILEKEDTLRDKLVDFGFHDSKKVVHNQFFFQGNHSVPQVINIQQNANPVGIAFVSLEPKRELQITSDRVVFSDYSYQGFDDFERRLKGYFKIIEKELGKLSPIKVGFRKINSIIVEPVTSYSDACSIFNPSLFGTLRSGIAGKDALKLIEESMVLELGQDICLIRNQFKQLDKADRYQAVLDFDLIRKEPGNIKNVMENILPSFNARHFDLFMWSITDTMIKLMEEE
ncbi:TIGR04255 family protein [Deltaproteobacteria bacterium TL4]